MPNLWWPHVETDCAAHYHSCSFCLPRLKAVRNVGFAIRAAGRFDSVQIDTWINPPEVQAATGMEGTHCMVDDVGGFTVFCPLVTQSTLCAAHCTVTRWVSVLGPMKNITHDQHPGYASAVFKEVCAILGVKLTAVPVDASRSLAVMGARQRILAKAIAAAQAAGNCSTLFEYELVLASAMQMVNQVNQTSGRTVYEKYFGQSPNDAAELMLESKGHDTLALSKYKPADAHLINLLHFHRNAMVAELHAQQEINARDNAAHQDFTVASEKGVKFKLSRGDKVSYRGMDYVLLDTDGPDPDRPINAVIADTKGGTHEVKFTLLRHAAITRPQLRLPTPADFSVGTLIFYQDGTNIFMGKVTNQTGDTLELQDYAPNDNVRTWLPLWIKSPADEQNPLVRRKEAPTGSLPHLTSISTQRFLITVQLTKGNFLEESTQYALLSLGIDLTAAPAHTMEATAHAAEAAAFE